MNEINQGLTISALGLIITFVALGVFILVMIVLQKLFPYKAEAAEEPERAAEEISVTTAEPAGEEDLVAAAIAVAIAAARKTTGSPALGASLTEGRSGYWSTNHPASRASRSLVKS